MKVIENTLEKLATHQSKYNKQFLIGALVLTFLLALCAPMLEIETDLNEGLPQDLPIFVLNDKVSDSFGGQDAVVIITQIDFTKDDPNGIKDIRNPETISFVQELEEKLSEDSNIGSIMSVNSYLQGAKFQTQEQLKSFLEMVPDANMFFSKDYTSTIIYVTSDVGSSPKKIDELTNSINEKIELTSQIPGTKTYITGTPLLNSTLGDLLLKDAAVTILFASLFILILLFILKKSFLKGTVIFLPLFISLIWTIGILGLLGIKLTIGTAGLGAMILGLGVEYSTFIFVRYLEERDKGKSQEKSLIDSVPKVGQAVVGSGITTLIGFLALTLSAIPVLRELGLTLAIGIFSTLVSTLIISPVIFTKIEKMHLNKLEKKRKNVFTNNH